MAYPRNDYTGQRFGRLVAVEPDGHGSNGGWRWKCLCDCGVEKTYNITDLKAVPGTTSCGCYRRESAGRHARTHGMTNTSEHHAWTNMVHRCYTPSAAGYRDYGGRGITVCDRWRASFEDFLSDMGMKSSSDLSIDRIDNEGNYEPGNCRWATRSEQSDNRRSSRLVEFGGRVQSVARWAEELNITRQSMSSRINKYGEHAAIQMGPK